MQGIGKYTQQGEARRDIMQPTQLAQTVLRLCRKRGMTLTVERVPDGQEPIVHARPAAQLTAYLRAALTLCEREVIALLEEERHG